MLIAFTQTHWHQAAEVRVDAAEDSISACIHVFFNGLPCVLALGAGLAGPKRIVHSVPGDGQVIDHAFLGCFDGGVDIEVAKVAVVAKGSIGHGGLSMCAESEGCDMASGKEVFV